MLNLLPAGIFLGTVTFTYLGTYLLGKAWLPRTYLITVSRSIPTYLPTYLPTYVERIDYLSIKLLFWRGRGIVARYT